MSSLMTNTDSGFWGDVDKHLIHYGTPFFPRIIVRASGSYVYDVEGNKILDFTSGQVRFMTLSNLCLVLYQTDVHVDERHPRPWTP